MEKEIIVIAGPTASGKSALAEHLAKKNNGTIINADAIQVYQDLKILTARPSENQNFKYALYGFLDCFETNSVTSWLTSVQEIIKEIKNPIFVGGTGLYIYALLNGLHQIPEIEPSVRSYVRQLNIEEIRKQVLSCPATDPQRLRRALEVQLSSGHPLSYFYEKPPFKYVTGNFHTIFLNPERSLLYRSCEERFYQMCKEGVLSEVKTLLSKNPSGGILKAIGLSEMTHFLAGKISFEEMSSQVILATRHYAKRQITWFKNKYKADEILTQLPF